MYKYFYIFNNMSFGTTSKIITYSLFPTISVIDLSAPTNFPKRFNNKSRPEGEKQLGFSQIRKGTVISAAAVKLTCFRFWFWVSLFQY